MRTKTLKTYTLDIEVVRQFDEKTIKLNKSQIIEDFMRKYNETA